VLDLGFPNPIPAIANLAFITPSRDLTASAGRVVSFRRRLRVDDPTTIGLAHEPARPTRAFVVCVASLSLSSPTIGWTADIIRRMEDLPEIPSSRPTRPPPTTDLLLVAGEPRPERSVLKLARPLVFESILLPKQGGAAGRGSAHQPEHRSRAPGCSSSRKAQRRLVAITLIRRPPAGGLAWTAIPTFFCRILVDGEFIAPCQSDVV